MDAARARRIVRAQVLAPTFWVTVLARVGKTEESQRALELAEAVLQNFEDPLIEVSLSALRATLLESRGDFQAALTEMTHTEQRWSCGGHTLGVYWARLHRGELLLRTGRVREGHHVLDDVARDAAIAGAELIVRQAAAARRADPRRGVVEFTPPSGPNRASANEPATPDPRVRTTRPGELRRDRVLAVFRAIAADELAVAQGRFAALMAEPGLDPLEVALLELVRPAVEHAADACFSTALAHAAELAGVAGADPELIVELDRWLRDARSRKVTPIIVDEHSAEIRVGCDVVSLSTRPTLRRLFNALLAEPGRSTAKADLASTLWPGRYRPERHDNALWVNLKRLRDLLHGTGLRVVTDPVGYRVDIEDGYRLVRPRLGRAH